MDANPGQIPQDTPHLPGREIAQAARLGIDLPAVREVVAETERERVEVDREVVRDREVVERTVETLLRETYHRVEREGAPIMDPPVVPRAVQPLMPTVDSLIREPVPLPTAVGAALSPEPATASVAAPESPPVAFDPFRGMDAIGDAGMHAVAAASASHTDNRSYRHGGNRIEVGDIHVTAQPGQDASEIAEVVRSEVRAEIEDQLSEGFENSDAQFIR